MGAICCPECSIPVQSPGMTYVNPIRSGQTPAGWRAIRTLIPPSDAACNHDRGPATIPNFRASTRVPAVPKRKFSARSRARYPSSPGVARINLIRLGQKSAGWRENRTLMSPPDAACNRERGSAAIPDFSCQHPGAGCPKKENFRPTAGCSRLKRYICIGI